MICQTDRGIKIFPRNMQLSEELLANLQSQDESFKDAKAGQWVIIANFVMVSKSDTKYLAFDPGKQAAGWDPGRDWFKKGDQMGLNSFYIISDTRDLTGDVKISPTGWNWDGSSKSVLFKDDLTVTLKFSETDPVVSVK